MRSRISKSATEASNTGGGAHRREEETDGGPREVGKHKQRDMKTRLDEQGIRFIPLAIEIGGAETGAWSKYIKKLSEIAHARRGHDKAYFVMHWTSEIAMCLAKRGGEVALRHAYKTAANNVLGGLYPDDSQLLCN